MLLVSFLFLEQKNSTNNQSEKMIEQIRAQRRQGKMNDKTKAALRRYFCDALVDGRRIAEIITLDQHSMISGLDHGQKEKRLRK